MAPEDINDNPGGAATPDPTPAADPASEPAAEAAAPEAEPEVAPVDVNAVLGDDDDETPDDDNGHIPAAGDLDIDVLMGGDIDDPAIADARAARADGFREGSPAPAPTPVSDDAPGWFSTFVGKYDQDTAETRDQIAQFGNEVGGLRTEVGDLRTGFGDLSSRVTALETGGGEALATRMLASTDVGEVLRQVIREDVTPQFASVHQRVDQVEATANEALATAKEARNLARAGGETNPFGVLAGAIIGAVVFGLFLWALADMTNVSDSNQYAMIILGVMAGALIGCNVGSSFRWPASNNETVAEAPTVEPAPARAVLPVRDPDAPPTEVVAVVR